MVLVRYNTHGYTKGALIQIQLCIVKLQKFERSKCSPYDLCTIFIFFKSYDSLFEKQTEIKNAVHS